MKYLTVSVHQAQGGLTVSKLNCTEDTFLAMLELKFPNVNRKLTSSTEHWNRYEFRRKSDEVYLCTIIIETISTTRCTEELLGELCGFMRTESDVLTQDDKNNLINFVKLYVTLTGSTVSDLTSLTTPPQTSAIQRKIASPFRDVREYLSGYIVKCFGKLKEDLVKRGHRVENVESIEGLILYTTDILKLCSLKGD